MPNQSWCLLRDQLTVKEQLDLFAYIQEHDATDWKNLSQCMNPSPKTLELLQSDGTTARTLCMNPDDDKVILDMINNVMTTMGWQQSVQSLSAAVIRYCPEGTNPCVGSCFPPHIDHCNDKSWVVLFSLGCTAIFQIKSKDMPRKETFRMQSGDVLLFDPSSGAAILHGVDSIENDNDLTRWTGMGKQFEVLRSSRYGLQCRVSWRDPSFS